MSSKLACRARLLLHPRVACMQYTDYQRYNSLNWSLHQRVGSAPGIPHLGSGETFRRRQAAGSSMRRPARQPIRAMVNVDVSPSVVLGVGLIGAGISLWQVRQAKPAISKDYDVVISCISLLVGGILIFQVRTAFLSRPPPAYLTLHLEEWWQCRPPGEFCPTLLHRSNQVSPVASGLAA
jgi:hypothetical protein